MSSSINPQNNRDLNQGILHLWSKFLGPSLNGWWVIAWTCSKWSKFWLWSWIWPWRLRSITPKTIGILTKVFYIYGPNLVILAETGHELSRGQARDWRTDGHTHTDAGNDNIRRPKLASGKNAIFLKTSLKVHSCEYCRTQLMISQHWFGQCLGAFRQQAITWTNTHLDLLQWVIGPWTKSTAFYQTKWPKLSRRSSKYILLEEICLFELNRHFVLEGPVHNNLSVVQTKYLRRIFWKTLTGTTKIYIVVHWRICKSPGHNVLVVVKTWWKRRNFVSLIDYSNCSIYHMIRDVS